MAVSHLSTISVAVESVLRQQQQQQQVLAVLALLQSFPVALNEQHLTIEALQLFYGLLSCLDQDWRGGSVVGRLPNIDRGREDAHQRLINDYFVGPDSTYPDTTFRRRFRMRRELFERLVDTLEAQDNYFKQRPDALGKMGASPLQKVTAAVRLLAYGGCADSLDEWILLSESTIQECLKRFVTAVIRIFGDEYLRAPTEDDVMRLLNDNAERGFPGCLGSIDCWHWEWKNCPSAWAAQYKGKKGKGCVAEMCCGRDLWIWHLFCGNPGSLNDINVLQRSPLLRQIYNGNIPGVEFQVNGKTYSCPYWLADGIYPELSIFVTGFAVPGDPIDKNFTYWQESVRKDIERAFGVLQARWSILTKAGKVWTREFLDNILECCVILHNMIVEDEHELHYTNDLVDDYEIAYDDFDGNILRSINHDIVTRAPPDQPSPFAATLRRLAEVNNSRQHQQLRDDLKHHLFENFPRYNKETYR